MELISMMARRYEYPVVPNDDSIPTPRINCTYHSIQLLMEIYLHLQIALPGLLDVCNVCYGTHIYAQRSMSPLRPRTEC
jgi:hypothetical protein